MEVNWIHCTTVGKGVFCKVMYCQHEVSVWEAQDTEQDLTVMSL